jgi:chaperone required for assembly of F1-ATPase
VDYLASTTTATFNQTALVEKITTFELQWQLEKWGSNDGEKWNPTGNLVDILMDIKAKWGDIF